MAGASCQHDPAVRPPRSHNLALLLHLRLPPLQSPRSFLHSSSPLPDASCRAVRPLPRPAPISQCKQGEIDSRVVASLSNLPPSDAIECLDKLEKAAQTSEIRNLSAYLAGVVKRVSTSTGGGGGSPPTGLAPAAQHELQALYASGRVRPNELNEKTLRTLGQEPADVQALVLRSFGERNLNGIRNMAGQRCARGLAGVGVG